MKLAISTYSLARWRREQNKTLEQSLDQIAALDVKAVEFAGLDDKATENPIGRARSLRRRCAKLGLAIPSYCIGAELLVPPDQQRQTIAQLKREVDIASELGCRSLRHDVTRGFGAYENFRGPRTFAAALKVAVPAIREVADYAQRAGIKSSLENHGFYMQAAQRIETLLKAVDHPNFGLTLDMGNFLCVNDDPVKAVARLAKYAVIAHAKDFHVRPKKTLPLPGWFATPTSIALRGAMVGHGAIDVPRQLQLLKRAGYDGYLSLEFEGIEEPLYAVSVGIAFLREKLTAIKALDA